MMHFFDLFNPSYFIRIRELIVRSLTSSTPIMYSDLIKNGRDHLTWKSTCAPRRAYVCISARLANTRHDDVTRKLEQMNLRFTHCTTCVCQESDSVLFLHQCIFHARDIISLNGYYHLLSRLLGSVPDFPLASSQHHNYRCLR